MNLLKRSLLICLILALFTSITRGQEQLKHKKTTYTNEKGRFFINKSLPVYLHLSTSAAPNAEKKLLKSETSPAYTNPLYFDTEGYNTIRTPSKVDTITKKVIRPIEDIIFEIYTDSRPPENTISFENSTLYRNEGKLYAGKGLTAVVKSTDKYSGVKQVFFSMDNAAFQPYTAAKELSVEKDYVLKYYSVDNVGNPSETETAKVIADFSAPVSQHKIEKDFYNNVISARTRMTLSAEDTKSGVKETYFQIDDGAHKLYYVYVPTKKLSEGKHTIKYWSVDKVGNKENAKSFEFYIDKSPPIVADEILGSNFMSNGRGIYSSGRTKFQLTAVDGKAGVKEIFYALGNEKYKKYEKPFYLPSRSGNLQIRFYAVDNVNNKGGNSQDSKRSTATYVDLTGPTLSYDYKGPKFKTRDTVFINNTTKISLKAVDAEAGLHHIGYTIDKGMEISYVAPFNISVEGVHHFDYVGYDNVDNTNRGTFYLIVDNTPPVIYERFSIRVLRQKDVAGQKLDVYPSHVLLFLSATDEKVGLNKIFYTINNGREKLYNAYIDGFKKNTTYTIKVRVIDKLGNESTHEIKFVTID